MNAFANMRRRHNEDHWLPAANRPGKTLDGKHKGLDTAGDVVRGKIEAGFHVIGA